jgi:hypothetical protein
MIDGVLYMGKYSKWLINLFKNDSLKLEDLYKAKQYLELFHKFNSKMIIKDINHLKSLPDLFVQIEKYIEYDEIIEDEKPLTGQFKEVFKNEDYRIIIPLTLEASKYFGRNTEWCTLNTDRFKEYTKKQSSTEITKWNLYILYSEKLNKRLQFHFQSNQFMNVKDKEINIEKFMDENKDIYNFFKQGFIPENYYKDQSAHHSYFYYYIDQSAHHSYPNKLSSLKNLNLPKIIFGDFSCYNNDLTSLEYCPEIIEGNFDCSNNKLTSLKYCPEKVEGNFDCSLNQLTSLEYAPKYMEGDFSCSDNKLTSLKYCPERIEGDFDCSNNQLTSLEFAPKYVGGTIYCELNHDLPKEEIERYKKTGNFVFVYLDSMGEKIYD